MTCFSFVDSVFLTTICLPFVIMCTSTEFTLDNNEGTINPEKLATLGTQEEDKQSKTQHNIHHYTQTNTNNV